MGLIRTTLLGVVGSFAGGAIHAWWSGGDPLTLQPASFFGSVLGAMAVLLVSRLFSAKS